MLILDSSNAAQKHRYAEWGQQRPASFRDVLICNEVVVAVSVHSQAGRTAACCNDNEEQVNNQKQVNDEHERMTRAYLKGGQGLQAGRLLLSSSLAFGGQQVIHAAVTGTRPAARGVQDHSPHFAQLIRAHIKGQKVSLKQHKPMHFSQVSDDQQCRVNVTP